MGKMMFGRDEKLACITDVQLRSPDGEPLCLGYKTTKYAFVAPLYFSDDGYVLVIKSGTPSRYLAMPEGRELEELQAEGLLPRPLPGYEIPIIEYLFGYLLWIVIAVVIAFGLVERWRKKRRHVSLDTDAPPSTDPPELRTKTDRWLSDEAAKHLEPGEHVQHQAYGFDRDLQDGAVNAKALYAVLTDRRVLFFEARVGAFGPLHENKRTTSFPRAAIESVQRNERHLLFVLAAGGDGIDFFAEWSERKLSNQRRFLRDVPRLVGASASGGVEAGAGASAA